MAAVLAPYQTRPQQPPSPYYPYLPAEAPEATPDEMLAWMREFDARLEAK